MLTIQENQRFDTLEDLFAHPGWKLVVDDALKQIYEFQSQALEVSSWDEVLELRGMAKQLAILTRLPDITAYEKQQLIEQRQAAEAEDDASL